MRRSHQIDQPLHRIRRIGDRQPRRRDAELAVHRGDAQIGLHRDRQPAAQAEAADAGDDRLAEAVQFSRPTPVSRSYSCCASAFDRFFSNWLISAPDTNALLPAPIRITTRTDVVARIRRGSRPARVHISSDMALRFSGWLKVISPMPSSFAASILPPAYSTVMPTGMSHHLRSLPSCASRRSRRRCSRPTSAFRPGARPASGVGRRMSLEKPEMLIAEATTSASPTIRTDASSVAMPQMFHLRIGEHLVDRVDRPARNAVAPPAARSSARTAWSG